MKSMISVFIVTLLSGVSAFAGTIADSLEPIGSEISGNGGCWSNTYNVNQFEYSIASKKFVTDAKERYSKPYLVFKWNDIVDGAKEVTSGDSDLFFSRLDFYMKKKKITAMFGAAPGDDCEESEYCSIFNFEIYFKDGSVLACDFDITT